jgi:hypothetical protein
MFLAQPVNNNHSSTQLTSENISCCMMYEFTKCLFIDSPSGVRKKRLSAVETQTLGTPPPKKRKIGRNDGTGEVCRIQ